MANQTDYTAMMKEMMGAFPVDTQSMQDVFRTQAAFADKMSKVVLEAAEKSSEISAAWTKSTLGKLGQVTDVKEDPADYTKALTDFASAQAEMSAESLAAFAEIAKRVQMETVELMMSAGKEISNETSSAVKKATKSATDAAKQATN